MLFQSITHMAPAVATALSIGAATSFAGGITPLAVLFAMIAVLFTAFSMAELARHLPSAGGMYTYVGRGLGSFFGWLVAWSFALAEPLVMPLLLGGFGFYGAIFLSSYLSIDFEFAWIALAILCGLVVWFLTYRGVGLSTRAGLVLGVIEIGIFLLISTLLIVNADNNTLSVFVPGEDGLKPAFQGMIFCLLAFIGFEAAAPLGEETREPRRTIPRAVIWSAILVGLFYVFCYYAATVFFGPDEMTGFYTSHDGDPWGFMAERGAPRHRWPAGRLRDPQQLARQRQRGRDGGDAIALRDGTGGAAAALLCGDPSRDPCPGQRGPLPGRDRDHHRGRARARARQRSVRDAGGRRQLRRAQRVRLPWHDARADLRRDLHAGEPGVHRLFLA